MTDEELIKSLEQYVRKGNCFTTEVRDILMAYKNAGRPKENAHKLFEKLAMDFSDNKLLQDRTYDILDIITGSCNSEMRVWD